MGRSRGGLTSKIHAVVDSSGFRCGSRSHRAKRMTIHLLHTCCGALIRPEVGIKAAG
jgi:hypothetical protein